MATSTRPSAAPAASHNGQNFNLPGYYGIAECMTEYPERTHLRSFPELSTLQLLVKQAEIIGLKEQLSRQVAQDHLAGDGVRSEYAVNWVALLGSRNEESGSENSEQIRLLDELDVKLRTYHEQLLQLHGLHRLPAPNGFDLPHLQEYLMQQIREGSYLRQKDGETWGSTAEPTAFAPDLVSLKPRYYEDKFSAWIADKALPKICGCLNLTSEDSGDPFRARDEAILRKTFYLSCALSSLLPFSFVLVLYFVHSAWGRLLVVGLSSLLFALALATMTNGRSSEIFVANCALLAVEIVFLGNNPSPS